ncbi:MAG TPA: glycosyltransferase, partial [Phycisphaeraceae bacterium]
MTQKATSHAQPRRLIIVPAYNEAGTIAQVVRELKRIEPDADVLVVDDGSTDATAQRVPAEAAVVRL